MTLSPSFTRPTFEPSFSTVPVPSSPGTQGNLAGLKPAYTPWRDMMSAGFCRQASTSHSARH